jgi:hypothetical protein
MMSNDQYFIPQGQTPLVPQRYVWPVSGLVVTFLLLIIIGGPIEQLALGWLYFLIRVLPKISADWPTAILGLVSVIAFVVGLHYTLNWFLKQSPVAPALNWRPRSTVVVATMLLLMFASGTAMVGATHQFIWWLSSTEPTAGDEEARAQLRIPALSFAVQAAREAALRTQAKNNLKQIGLAMHNFADIHKSLPPGGILLTDGTPLHGWAISLSAYGSFYAPNLDYSIPWNEPPNDNLFKCEVYDFVNPSLSGPYFDQAGYGLNHYAANIHVFPIRTVDRHSNVDLMTNRQGKDLLGLKFADITDGTSNTIMLGTVVDRLAPWGHPANVRDPALGINRSPDGFGGPPQWRGGMFLMCDGSVRFINEKVDPKVMQVLGTPASGDAIPNDHNSEAGQIDMISPAQ